MPARVTSQGPTARLGAAILPVPAADCRAFQSRGQVSGNPGTRLIDAPAPQAVPQQWNRALHRSSDAPTSWRPSLYYLIGDQEHAPVSVLSDNQMPVPAISPTRKAAVMMKAPPQLRQRQVGWPVVSPAFRPRS